MNSEVHIRNGHIPALDRAILLHLTHLLFNHFSITGLGSVLSWITDR